MIAKKIVFSHCRKLKKYPYKLNIIEVLLAKIIKGYYGEAQCREWSLIIGRE